MCWSLKSGRQKKHCLETRNRLRNLLGFVKRIRSSVYPEGWSFDPLYKIEKEIESILNENENS